MRSNRSAGRSPVEGFGRPRGAALALVLVGLALCGGARVAAQELTPDGRFRKEEVGVGVTLWQYLPATYGKDPQSISVLEVDPRVDGVRVGFAAPGGFVKTSRAGREGRAVAAVNGGFFTKEAKAVGMLRIGGKDLGTPHPARTAGIAATKDGKPIVASDPAGVFAERAEVMAAGPLLLTKGAPPPGSSGWKPERHPRTAAGTTSDGRFLLVTVDGRTPESRGMSFAEFAGLLKELGAVEAVNLDGGGSTTLWVRNEPEGGIVNFPCDNKKHDRAGERAVANAVLVFARDVIVADTDEATFAPEGAWTRSKAGEAILGPDFAVASEHGATATWSVELSLPGDYDVEVRFPRLAAKAAELEGRIDGQPTRVRTGDATGRWKSVAVVRVAEPRTIAVTLEAPGGAPAPIDALRLVQRAAPATK